MRKTSFIPTSLVGKLGTGLAACGLVLALATGLASAGGFDVWIPELGRSVPAEKAAAVRHSLRSGASEPTKPAPAPTGRPDRIPAKLLGPEVPVPISPTILRTTNGWLVSDGVSLVAVYAGAAGNDPSQGRVVIVKQDLVAGVQTQTIVDAGQTGTLGIVSAPLGPRVETSAQRGELGLRGPGGASFVLNMSAENIHAS
jgi:hypothetical protein